jgi:hypothetical protein
MAGDGKRDSTRDSHIDLADGNNNRLSVSTKYDLINNTHTPRVFLGAGDDSLSAYGLQKVVNDVSLFHSAFTFDVNPILWTYHDDGVEVTTTTRATSIGGRLNVTSGAISGDSCYIKGRRHPRYQPNRGLKWASSIGFKGANKDGIIKVGMLEEGENGIYFKTIGDGKLYACVLSNGIETHMEEIVFNFDIDIEKGNNYDIQVQWRGIGDIKYTAFNPSTGLGEVVHFIRLLGTLDEKVGVENPALPAAYYTENVTEEVSVWAGCVDITSEGGVLSREQYASTSVTATVSSGDGIIELKQPEFINGKTNSRDILPSRITVSSDKKVDIDLYQTRNSAGVTGGSYATFFTGSFVEKNTTMTSVTVGSMNLLRTFNVPANLTSVMEVPTRDTTDFALVAKDSLVLVCTTGAVAIVDITIEWGEEI